MQLYRSNWLDKKGRIEQKRPLEVYLYGKTTILGSRLFCTYSCWRMACVNFPSHSPHLPHSACVWPLRSFHRDSRDAMDDGATCLCVIGRSVYQTHKTECSLSCFQLEPVSFFQKGIQNDFRQTDEPWRTPDRG
jgi:hypothetical protein